MAVATGHLARFVVFGSFVTDKSDPNDIDIFMIMDDAFQAGELERETKILFDHPSAQSYFGASVFWIRRLAALGGEAAAVEHWQLKRDGNLRGIVEVLFSTCDAVAVVTKASGGTDDQDTIHVTKRWIKTSGATYA